MSLKEELEEAFVEEGKAWWKYSDMARKAYDAGQPSFAVDLERIATDEYQHANMLRRMIASMETEPEPSRSSMAILDRSYLDEGRIFPKSYGDWITLAEDIKTADPSLTSMVNYELGLIQQELPGADDAKRWLTRKAGELNIS